MRVVTRNDRGSLQVALFGELDECSSDYVRNVIDTAITTTRYNAVVFDMMGVRFMDSTGIGVLLGRYKILKRLDINVYITNCSAHVDKILSMSGIYNIIKKII